MNVIALEKVFRFSHSLIDLKLDKKNADGLYEIEKGLTNFFFLFFRFGAHIIALLSTIIIILYVKITMASGVYVLGNRDQDKIEMSAMIIIRRNKFSYFYHDTCQ